MTKNKLTSLTKLSTNMVVEPQNITANQTLYTKKTLDQIEDVIQAWRQELYNHYNLHKNFCSFMNTPEIKGMFTPASIKNICDHIESVHPQHNTNSAFITFFEEFIVKQTKTKMLKLKKLITTFNYYQTVSNALIKSWNDKPLSDEEANSILLPPQI